MRVHSYEEFFRPIQKGKFWWSNTAEGIPALLLQWGHKRGQHVLLYTSRQPNNWSAPGPVNGWDGNWDAPTLHPSIGINRHDGSPGYEWHGFLENGVLRDA